MPIDKVFASYKYQPTLENRHRFLKSSLEVVPVNLNNPARIEALLFLYFIALLVHALIEREVRRTMETRGILSIMDPRNWTGHSVKGGKDNNM